MSVAVDLHYLDVAAARTSQTEVGKPVLWVAVVDTGGNSVTMFLHRPEQAQKLRDAAQEALDILEAREDNDG